MDEDTSKTEIIQKLKDEIDALEEKIRTTKNEKKEQSVELTMCKAEKHQLEMDNSEKDKIILELKTKLEAIETRHSSALTNSDTQTDRDDLDTHDVMPYSPNVHSYNVDYNHSITDTWCTIQVHRTPEAEPPGHSNIHDIYVYNTNMQKWDFNPVVLTNARLLSLRPGEKIYYHGSNDCNVKNILEKGIDVTKSTRATDFSCGGGFYLTTCYERAVQWSRKVAVWKRGRPAVIAFKISHNLRKEEPHLALNKDTTTTRKFWECVVSHFRHGERSADVRNTLKDVKFIKGWVANNQYLGDEETPRRYDFTQLCIRNQEYGRRFGSLTNVAFVLFDVSN